MSCWLALFGAAAEATRRRDHYQPYWWPVEDETLVAVTRPGDDALFSTVAIVRIAMRSCERPEVSLVGNKKALFTSWGLLVHPLTKNVER